MSVAPPVWLTGVGHDDFVALVRTRLPEQTSVALLDELNLEARLSQLVSWGTLEAWQDRAETEADFLRNRSGTSSPKPGRSCTGSRCSSRPRSAQARPRR